MLLEKLRGYRRLAIFRAQLTACTVGASDSDELPNVLCIGVPKAATTWLYARLNMHPEVFLPRGKELHFFNEQYHVKASNPVFDHEKTKLFWHYKFDLSKDSHWRWYRSQFRRGKGKTKIDITPTYCRASKKRIREIKKTLPEAKIILVIRNPIERAWSGAGYFLDRYEARSLADLDATTELKPWVFDSERLDYGNYIDMIENWDDIYSVNQQIKYIFYDDIKRNPRLVLEEICSFIDVDSSLLPAPKDDEKTVNSNYHKTIMAESIKNELVELYRPQVDFLERRFDRDLSNWLV